MSRRSFLNTSVAVGSAAAISRIIPGAWVQSARAATLGFFESEFGMSDELCKKALDKALSKGGDFADIYFEHTISNWVSLEDGKVDRAYGSVDLGVGIRTVKGEQTGYGFTQELTEESILAAAATAATIADGAPTAAAKSFLRLETENYYPLETLFSDISLAAKLPLVKSVNEKCFSLSNLIIKVNATMHDQQKRIMIVTSDGSKAQDLIPRSYLSASVVAEKDGRQERAGWNFGGRQEFSYFNAAVIDRLAEEVVRRAVILFEAEQPPAGEMPVVLGPGVTGILLHEAIGHGMEADFNRKGISTYSTMIGKKVAEPFVNIIDEGITPRQLGSVNVDDEGVPGQATMLVENGILTSYLHDRISAKHYGVKPTGNGRRQSYQHYPIPRMRNTYMLAGKSTPEEVIKSVKKGIYVEDISNGQVKIGEGDFAFYVSQGKMIEEGALTRPVKDINIMGNGPKMLQNVTMVANDLKLHEGGTGACGKDGQSMPVSFGLPTCLVKSMTVGGVQKQGA
ncbi:TldD/PmbA family protein [candidate division KSB1 bacterium]|nr:TldD/PmbA family protein [candidate division KSB1 bacterium]RQW01753.1 MAG: TldD/PmbA family protein [candidate division KSB1 bacterium]